MKNNYYYDVSIIIISHNHEKYIEKCLNSINEHTIDITFEIILIDNLGNGECKKIIENNNIDVKLVENNKPYGFSKNNNIGVKQSNGKYILILNPDTVILNNAIKILYDFIKNKKNVGAVGPKLLFPNGSIQYSCRKYPTIFSFFIRRTPLRIFYSENSRGKKHLMTNWGHNYNQRVDWLLGACLLIKKETFLKVGMFDENFNLYCEDIDLCFQFNKQGFHNYYVVDAEVIHYHQKASDRKFISRNNFSHYKSMLYFVIKNKYYKNL